MMWGNEFDLRYSDLDETHHIDQMIYNRLQWLAGLMQGSEPGSDAQIKDYLSKRPYLRR